MVKGKKKRGNTKGKKAMRTQTSACGKVRKRKRKEPRKHKRKKKDTYEGKRPREKIKGAQTRGKGYNRTLENLAEQGGISDSLERQVPTNTLDLKRDESKNTWGRGTVQSEWKQLLGRINVAVTVEDLFQGRWELGICSKDGCSCTGWRRMRMDSPREHESKNQWKCNDSSTLGENELGCQGEREAKGISALYADENTPLSAVCGACHHASTLHRLVSTLYGTRSGTPSTGLTSASSASSLGGLSGILNSLQQEQAARISGMAQLQAERTFQRQQKQCQKRLAAYRTKRNRRRPATRLSGEFGRVGGAEEANHLAMSDSLDDKSAQKKRMDAKADNHERGRGAASATGSSPRRTSRYWNRGHLSSFNYRTSQFRDGTGAATRSSLDGREAGDAPHLLTQTFDATKDARTCCTFVMNSETQRTQQTGGKAPGGLPDRLFSTWAPCALDILCEKLKEVEEAGQIDLGIQNSAAYAKLQKELAKACAELSGQRASLFYASKELEKRVVECVYHLDNIYFTLYYLQMVESAQDLLDITEPLDYFSESYAAIHGLTQLGHFLHEFDCSPNFGSGGNKEEALSGVIANTLTQDWDLDSYLVSFLWQQCSPSGASATTAAMPGALVSLAESAERLATESADSDRLAPRIDAVQLFTRREQLSPPVLLQLFVLRWLEGLSLVYSTGLMTSNAAHMDRTREIYRKRQVKAKSLDAISIATAAIQPAYESLEMWRSNCREWLCHIYSYAVPNEASLNALASIAPILEIGAGTGYWAYLLQSRGVDCVAYDKAPPSDQVFSSSSSIQRNDKMFIHPSRRQYANDGAYDRHGRRGEKARKDPPSLRDRNEYHGSAAVFTRVQSGGTAVGATYPGHTLFLCYPPPDSSMALETVRAFAGQRVAYVGEWEGTTGTRAFQDEMMSSWTLESCVDLPNYGNTCYALFIWKRGDAKKNALEKKSKKEQAELANSPESNNSAIVKCSACGSGPIRAVESNSNEEEPLHVITEGEKQRKANTMKRKRRRRQIEGEAERQRSAPDSTRKRATLWRCSYCRKVVYCSDKCMKAHAKVHRALRSFAMIWFRKDKVDFTKDFHSILMPEGGVIS